MQIGHKIDPQNMIGNMICGICYYPATCDPADIELNRHMWEQKIFYCGDVQCKGEYPSFTKRVWAAHDVDESKLDITDEDLVELKRGTVDMYTFSYYMSQNVTTHTDVEEVGGNMSSGVRNPYLQYSDWGWSTDPSGLTYYLEVVNDRYHLPIIVTENGLGAFDTVEEDGASTTRTESTTSASTLRPCRRHSIGASTSLATPPGAASTSSLQARARCASATGLSTSIWTMKAGARWTAAVRTASFGTPSASPAMGRISASGRVPL